MKLLMVLILTYVVIVLASLTGVDFTSFAATLAGKL
jgi:hypothetical protein